jgi:hypothetical protein
MCMRAEQSFFHAIPKYDVLASHTLEWRQNKKEKGIKGVGEGKSF